MVLLTDSGLETWLIFHRDVDLPCFASFVLLDDADGRELLAEYFRAHLEIAAAAGVGMVLETPTWRANPSWGAQLGYDAAAVDRINRDSVAFVRGVAATVPEVEVVVSGQIGPKGDGYDPDELLSTGDAAEYHRAQIRSFAQAGVDRVTFLTATHSGEAAGVVRAAAEAGLPVVASFTVETDGRLQSGETLQEAIEVVDAETDGAALQLGINCAHPDHFTDALGAVEPGPAARIGLLRANASRASHAELDEATELDDGDPAELGRQYADLLHDHPSLQVLGGCCGTDARHIAAIAQACLGG